MKLVMQGFGPFKDEQVIDFTMFQSGVFLIAGPTGAGKSTIFDAICLALYGKILNDKNQKEMIYRGSEEVRTAQISFTFEHNLKEYTVKRKIYRSNANGKSELTLPDGQKITKEINEYIIQLIGLDIQQFQKVVMLPQGKFEKLLLDNDRNKQVLLRQICGTQIIEHFITHLKEVYKEQTQTLVQLETNLAATKQNLLPYDEQYESCQNLHAQITDKHILLRKLEQQINQFERELTKQAQIKQQHEQLATYQAEYQELQDQTQEINEKRQIVQQLMPAKQIQNLEMELMRWQNEEQELQNLQKAIGAEYQTSAAEYQQMEAQYQNLGQLEQEQEEFQIQKERRDNLAKENQVMLGQLEQLAALETKKEQLLATNQEHLTAIADLNSKLNDFKQWEQEEREYQIAKPQLKHQQASLEAQIIELESLMEQEATYQLQLSKFTALERQEQELQTVYRAKQQQYQELSETYLLSVVAELAEKLEVNMPCPVCGSTEHPNPNPQHMQKIDYEKVDAYKKQLAEQEQKLSDVQQEIRKQSTALQALQPKLPHWVQEYATTDFAALSEKLRTEQQQVQAQLEQIEQFFVAFAKQQTLKEQQKTQLKQLIIEQEQEQTELVKLEQQLKQLEQEVTFYMQEHQIADIKQFGEQLAQESEDLAQQITALRDRRTQIRLHYLEVKENYDRLHGQKQEVEKSLADNKDKLAQAKQAFEQMLAQHFTQAEYEQLKQYLAAEQTLISQIQAYEVNNQRLQEQIALLKQQTKDTQLPDLHVLEAEKQQLTAQKDELNIELGTLQQALVDYQKYVQLLHNQEQEYHQFKVQYDNLHALYEVTVRGARGQNANDFEMFVQMHYLDQIILKANYHLGLLTDNRYLLRRKERTLTIEVLDNYSGELRRINTLSGGETFKASLALALGLSDTISEQTSHMKIDMLFIDEGFGTLDDNSIEQVLNVFDDLQQDGRTIGIISHVDLLKQQIYEQIQVKSEYGQSHLSLKI